MHMEDCFLESFAKGIETPETFVAKPWYDKYRDRIVYRCVDEGAIGDRVDPPLTLYRSSIDGRLLGFQLEDVKVLAEKFGAECVCVDAAAEEKIDGKIDKMEIDEAFSLPVAYEQLPITIRRRYPCCDVTEVQVPPDPVTLRFAS